VSALDSANQIIKKFGDGISGPSEFRGEVTIELADCRKIEKVCRYAKEKLGFDMLLDATSIDNYGDDPRWTLVYELFGTGHLAHLRIKTSVGEEKGSLPTVSTVWATADWHEREIFDIVLEALTASPANLGRAIRRRTDEFGCSRHAIWGCRRARCDAGRGSRSP
jgi:NADH-quinone oxidoreductase subunit C